ncbi:unnamed protein product [Trichobilharzia regenti]|nr:unnamed protein product [Trichobilharzia regenti]
MNERGNKRIIRYREQRNLNNPPTPIRQISKKSTTQLMLCSFQQINAWPDFQLAAFTDLNADRRMDIIFANNDGTKLFAVIQPSAKGFQFASTTQSSINFAPPVEIMGNVLPKTIRSVATADFDGDSRVDLLLITSDSVTGPFDTYIAYGLKGENRGKFGKLITYW